MFTSSMLSGCQTLNGVAYQGEDIPGSQLTGDSNITDVEDCRSFCRGQSGAAFFTFDEKKRSCVCRSTEGEKHKVHGKQSGMILDQG